MDYVYTSELLNNIKYRFFSSFWTKFISLDGIEGWLYISNYDGRIVYKKRINLWAERIRKVQCIWNRSNYKWNSLKTFESNIATIGISMEFFIIITIIYKYITIIPEVDKTNIIATITIKSSSYTFCPAIELITVYPDFISSY